ncbi:aspartate ammonia-lyase [Limnochorda sp.]|uniref:aspartate ammonia-lyase n=1 Tax=Limnochorda sp. TaxID=1940279 RepID=UPI001ECDDA6A|nr:aspartate ammonia-lyase [Bacillota bacterium]
MEAPAAFRIERDSLGERRVPADAYYGVQTVRAWENFTITRYRPNPLMIRAVGDVKWACTKANVETGALPAEMGAAILQACEEVSQGKWDDQFIVDPVQGGAGTSFHMNANEVIANRALELLGRPKGDYSQIHPNTHVNMAQSTNDVVPTALRLASLRAGEKTVAALKKLAQAFGQKAEEFAHVLKQGRTHLQDAVPILLGQEFEAYRNVVQRDAERLLSRFEDLLAVNLGGTAVGTGLNASPEYIQRAVANLAERTGYPFRSAQSLVDLTQNVDAFLALSSALRDAASNLTKVANDLRLMASGPRNGFGEIHLPPLQPGSSIMPGKVNPVIPEAVNQVAYLICGNDLTITLAAQNGQLELNVMLPVVSVRLLESLEVLANVAEMLADRCVVGITANEARCAEEIDRCVGVATALNPYIGYDQASQVAKESLATGKPVRQIVIERGLLPKEQVDEILRPERMTAPQESRL